MDTIYNAEQVAEHFGITIYTVRDWVKRGILHGFKAGRDWRFTQQDIAECQARLQTMTQERQQSYASTLVKKEKQASSSSASSATAVLEAPTKSDIDVLTADILTAIAKIPGVTLPFEKAFPAVKKVLTRKIQITGVSASVAYVQPDEQTVEEQQQQEQK